MSFQHGKDTKIICNQYDLSSYFSSADMTWDVDTPEVTTFSTSDYSRQYIAGLRNGTFSFAGFYSATSSLAEDAAISPLIGSTTPMLITYAPQGLTVNQVTYSAQSFINSYSPSSPVDGVAAISLDAQGHQKISRGVSLSNLTARTSDGSATVVNQTAATSSGGVGFLHLTDVSVPATGSLAVAIQDSPTSSPGSWADLVAFTAVTSSTATSERKTVTGNVDQYVRAEWAFASVTSGAIAESATFAVTFERN